MKNYQTVIGSLFIAAAIVIAGILIAKRFRPVLNRFAAR